LTWQLTCLWFSFSGAALFAVWAKGAQRKPILPRNKLERRYHQRHLHFITCSCYRRLPFLRSVRKRELLLDVLSSVREKYQFSLIGYVIMPEHIHILISEPRIGTPGTVMQVFKQRVARAVRRKRQAGSANQLRLWKSTTDECAKHFWQRRFYDFNVWTTKKRIEKLNYMHMNPVKRGLVEDPKLWLWSSYRFYQYGERNGCTPDREPRYGMEEGKAILGSNSLRSLGGKSKT
jgi:putative transposase